jgi:hypothetical protein
MYLGGCVARRATPGYPLQVRPRCYQRTSGFSLLSLPQNSKNEIQMGDKSKSKKVPADKNHLVN